MLVRALKVLNYFVIETIGTGIDTAALDQPGDEGALMAEERALGNDEHRTGWLDARALGSPNSTAK